MVKNIIQTKIGYKWLTSNMRSMRGNLTWKLGEWKKYSGKLKICKRGLHASPTPLDSLEYIYGNRWFIVEYSGNVIKEDDKFVASKMRIVKELDSKRILIPFACLCARRCLKNYEKEYPKDFRPRKAIEAAEECIRNPTAKNKGIATRASWKAQIAADEEFSVKYTTTSAGEAACAGEAAWSAMLSAQSASRSIDEATKDALILESSENTAARSASASRFSFSKRARNREKKWQNEQLLKLIKMVEKRI